MQNANRAYRMLNNRTYSGEAVQMGASYPGEHAAIIERMKWDRVHTILQENPGKRAARTRAETPALLKGLLFVPDGAAYSPMHPRKAVRLRIDDLTGLARDARRQCRRGSVTRRAPIPETVTLHVPFRVVKRGRRKEMALPNGGVSIL